MGNRIKKDSIFIVAETLIDNSAQKAGEVIGYHKDDNNRWITEDINGNKFQNLISNLRNGNYYKILKQYSVSDIVDYLRSRNKNYYTVCYEFIVNAIHTAFRETRISSIDDIYGYVHTYLL